MKKILFIVSAASMIIPFALEFLLSAGVLKEYGSTITDRQPAYAALMFAGLAGMIIYLIITYLPKQKSVRHSFSRN